MSEVNVFQAAARVQPTFQDGKTDQTRVDVFLGSQKQRNSFLSLSTSLSHAHPFCRPQLIHIVTPFNRGQAVKDPITEVKHTFQILLCRPQSVDYKFYVENVLR